MIISTSSNIAWNSDYSTSNNILNFVISLAGSAGAVFAGSTCALASIRDKDDYKNWAFGGALAGSIFGIQG